jgi:hypothetical protein
VTTDDVQWEPWNIEGIGEGNRAVLSYILPVLCLVLDFNGSNALWAYRAAASANDS